MAKVTPQRVEIQQAEVKNRASLTESLFARVASSINWIIENATEQVGDIKESLLTEAQFQDQRNDKWVLMDGRDISASDLAALTGMTSLPDARSTYLKCKDNGRGLDSAGDPALGSFQNDQSNRIRNFNVRRGNLPWNTGTFTLNENGNYTGYWGTGEGGSGTDRGQTRARLTGDETRPKTTIVNFFIKINA